MPATTDELLRDAVDAIDRQDEAPKGRFAAMVSGVKRRPLLLGAAVLALLPSMKAPTVNELAGDGGYAVETVVSKTQINTLIPELKDAGATGILELPISKIIP